MPAAVERLHPDVVLMDIRMPVIDGIAVTEALRRRWDSPPVLVLTTFEDEEVLAAALRTGASGFLLKGVPVDDLQRAVRAVLTCLNPMCARRETAVWGTIPGLWSPLASVGRDGYGRLGT
ncbi:MULTISPECIES: response regulator [Protofrankia]|uniref:response regulator n=1 Tax=Protofrankia TaxID=2994361 RepID=UPI0001C53C05|nr:MULTISPECIES: response regulator transcription factor [Protofrankia]